MRARPRCSSRPTVAAALSGAPGRVNAIGVIADPGTSDGRTARPPEGAPRAAGSTSSIAGHAADADAGDPTAADRAGLIAIFGALGGIAGAVALFVVAGTFALAIAQRRRETAVLRALGATPRQIRRLIAGEALLVSLRRRRAGRARRPTARESHRRTSSRIAARSDRRSRRRSSIVPLVAALGMGVVIAQLAVFAAARRAGRIPPADALREVAIEHPRPGSVRVVCRRRVPGRRRRDVDPVLGLLGDGVRGARRHPARDGHGTPRALAARDPGRRARGAAATGRRVRAARAHGAGGEPLADRGVGDADRARDDARRHPGHRRVQQPAPHRGRDTRLASTRRTSSPAPTVRRLPAGTAPRSQGSVASTPSPPSCRRRSIRSPAALGDQSPWAAAGLSGAPTVEARSTPAWCGDRSATSRATRSPSAACSRTAATYGSATRCRPYGRHDARHAPCGRDLRPRGRTRRRAARSRRRPPPRGGPGRHGAVRRRRRGRRAVALALRRGPPRRASR